MGNLGPERTQKRAVWGVWGPAHAPGAIWAKKWGFWFRVTAQAQKKTQKQIWGHGRVPVAKQGQKEEFRAQNGLRRGNLGLIRRPRSTARSGTKIWGRPRAPGAKRAQKGPFWVRRAPPAQDQLRKGVWGPSRAPLAARAENGGFWGRRVPGPRRYLLCWLTFLILGAISSFLSLFVFWSKLSILGRIKAVLALSLWGGERDNTQPPIPHTCSSIPLLWGKIRGKRYKSSSPSPGTTRKR